MQSIDTKPNLFGLLNYAKRQDHDDFMAMTMRIIVSCAALLVGLISAGNCWIVLAMKNVYFRPVLASVEAAEGTHT